MKFRPCIDIHEGVVKQIVGSTLNDDACSVRETSSTALVENFVATKPAAEFARLCSRSIGKYLLRPKDICANQIKEISF